MILTLKLQIFRDSFDCLRCLLKAPERTDLVTAKDTRYHLAPLVKNYPIPSQLRA